MDRNINEPGFDEEGIFRDKKKEEEEEEKVIPVEYLSYVQRRRRSRVLNFFCGIILIIVLAGIAPSTKGIQMCPRCGRTRAYNTLAWGEWKLPGFQQVRTSWTDWYESRNPELHTHHWVVTGITYPGLFIFLTSSYGIEHDWKSPENLMDRLRELSRPRYFRPGKVLDIPRVLGSVNNGREWNAIIEPLTLGTASEAFAFWETNEAELKAWADQPWGTPMPETFLAAADAYVKEMTAPDGNIIPLIH